LTKYRKAPQKGSKKEKKNQRGLKGLQAWPETGYEL
jgi:hypothetical protein